jgi:hypothetical protein
MRWTGTKMLHRDENKHLPVSWSSEFDSETLIERSEENSGGSRNQTARVYVVLKRNVPCFANANVKRLPDVLTLRWDHFLVRNAGLERVFLGACDYLVAVDEEIALALITKVMILSSMRFSRTTFGR